ncbi:hypothetical protein JS532_06160 [Bifidobacterium callimiconis]|uniref:hypothetical protein n=1 Tax=Bifidobacterium callimiconis TaxID=2306973 RepID=UPI001BDC0E1D|nr:hypothetical protein [Bifidobacterium callimiconis]MBT1177150.1 hypothetical protein [Bifidobacterium callimiconis]
MGKTLVLVPNNNFYYFEKLRLENVVVSPVFRDVRGIGEILWKTSRKMKLSASSFFYADWYMDLGSFSKIIVFDVALWMDSSLIRNIRHRIGPSTKCYLYSWNIVRDEKRIREHIDACGKYNFSYYSYDKNDCEKYGFHFNTIMYDESLRLHRCALSWDILFLGYLKDRKAKMLALYEMLCRASMTPKFVIVGAENEQKDLPFTIRDSYVSYFEYLDMVSRSRAILDITQEGQNGFSMRVMEAIAFDKKLVSTNMALLETSFYDPHNILVIDLQNPDENALSSFLNTDFHPYSEEIKHYYSVESWIKRFEC